MYTRGREHFHALHVEQQEESPIMWKHCCDRHERNEVLSFVMNVTGIFRDDAMLRQITESVMIK